MKTHTTTHSTNKVQDQAEEILDDAQALLSATADVAGEKVADARNRLNSAIARGKETWGKVREHTVAGAKVTDQAIRDNPYVAVGIAVGVGAILGYLLGRRRD
jgi:ElaB/YqjD/DUF883 family membrane-anchored ribosome-binding protein